MKLIDASETHDFRDVLEQGNILFFPDGGFSIPERVRSVLMASAQDARSFHKNIAYKPNGDRISGLKNQQGAEEVRSAMREYSDFALAFLARILPEYAEAWKIDYASFRSIEERGRDLPLTKRNDLLHVDAFPTRPVFGDLILRCFTNISSDQPRSWMTSDPFGPLAEAQAENARLSEWARQAESAGSRIRRAATRALAATGAPVVDRSPYDSFMLHFHDWLKANQNWQENTTKYHFELPPGSTWLVFTDLVPHAVLGGRFAVEQTVIISRRSLKHPELAPASILERLAGRTLTT